MNGRAGAGTIVVAVAWSFLAVAGDAYALINPDQVLVVYNSQSPDAQTVLNAYVTAHPNIPAGTNENIFDLNDGSIADAADISYDDFVTKIRNPIRAYLNVTGPSASSIVSIVLIRGIPHRIQDTDNATVGDVPSSAAAEFNDGDVTYASVDAELVLLWQDLDSGEGGATMDSYSDNIIVNPYHKSSTSIQSYSRSTITGQKRFSNMSNVAWGLSVPANKQLTPGDIYLVCRIDGTTAADAQAIITRAQDLVVNRRYTRIILDEHDGTELDNIPLFDPPGSFYAGDDYEETRDLLQAGGWNVVYDATADFIEGGEVPRPVIAYASYGENHNSSPPGDGVYIDDYYFARGAVFNTIESYNGRAFNGLGTKFNQEQIADFITAGGTFGVGHVWEPFAFSIPDNEFLVPHLLINGLTWAEAAWSSIPTLSWAHVVVGDPLARVMTVTDRLADFDANNRVDLEDLEILKNCATGPAVAASDPGCFDTDFDLDNDTDIADFALWQRCRSDGTIPPIPSCE